MKDDLLKIFQQLPHFSFETDIVEVADDGYAPTLCHYDGEWHVEWVSSEGDGLMGFSDEYIEVAILKAFEGYKAEINHLREQHGMVEKNCN